MSNAETFTGETRRMLDDRTGAEVVRLTSADGIHHTPYFTQSAVMADEDTVVFASDRRGGWNLFRASLTRDCITQMTTAGDVNAFSVATDPARGRVYYTAGAQVRSLDVASLNEEVLADLGEGSLGGCDVSPDGVEVLTVKRGVGDDTLVIVASDGSSATAFFAPPREIGYAQFCPTEPHWILYSSGIEQRMWTVSTRGLKDRPVYLHDSRQWITHESFRGDSDEILFTKWPNALMGIRRNGDDVRTVARLNAWHASSSSDGALIVADTTRPDIGLRLIDPVTGRHALLCDSAASSQGRRWASDTPEPGPVRPDTYGPQWTHPHPAFSPGAGWVTYTSDRDGTPHVYATRVPDHPEWEGGHE